MARRISTGIVGKNVLGSLSTSQNTIVSVVEDDDIILDPSGQGDVLVESDVFIQDANLLKLGDSDSSHWIGLRAPASVSSNVTLTFPATAGTDGYVLTTNGSGTLSWANVAVQVGDNISSDSVNPYYLTMTGATSGGINELKIISTKFEVDAADGSLLLKGNTASTNTTSGTLIVTGGIGVSGQMTAQTIVETSSIALKENIEPIDNALDSILRLKGVTYDRLDNNEHESGLIAEWVEEVLPDLVTRDNDGKVVGIKYTKLTAYLIEAVKDLSAQINKIKQDKYS